MTFIRRADLEIDELRCIWLDIDFPNTKSLLINVCYRPCLHQFVPTNFKELLHNSLIKASSKNKEMILIKDFNINYRKVDDNGKSIFTLSHLKQIYKTAARVTDKTESLIDLVFTNAPFNITMNDVYALSFSDHDLIGCNCKQNRVKTPQKIMPCRNYRLYDHNKLKNTDWSPLYISHSISDLLQAFNRILTEFFERHAPFATTKTNTNIFPWLTVKLKKRNELQDVLQDVLLRKFCKSKTTEKYEKYKRQRNKVNYQIKRAKQNYNKNLLDENTKNAAAFWRILKSIFPTKSKLKLTSTTFNVNEEETLNKETIANGFGQFFSNIATILHLIKDSARNKPKNLPIRTTQKLLFCAVKNL